MLLTGARGQNYRDILYSINGTITSPTAPQLLLPEHRSRSTLVFSNFSTHAMYLEIGAGEATCTLTSGAVSAVSVTNGGFGYTIAPVIEFLGGGSECNSTFLGVGSTTYGAPGSSSNFGQGQSDTPGNRPAQAHAIISGGVISSIVVDDGGAGYVAAPFVLIRNNPNDPFGCADPSKNSGSGIYVPGQGLPLRFDATVCPTGPVAVYCATSGSGYSVKWMP
jgi:hypothetical protein